MSTNGKLFAAGVGVALATGVFYTVGQESFRKSKTFSSPEQQLRLLSGANLAGQNRPHGASGSR